MSLWTTKAHQLLAAQAQQLAEIIQDADQPDTQAYRATAGGDERKLRGIPAVARGVQGAIPGTRPGDTLRP